MVARDFSGCPTARALVDDSRPLLDAQAASSEALRRVGARPRWRQRPAGGRRSAAPRRAAERSWRVDEANALLTQVASTLPVLLANLTTVSRIAVTYHARWNSCSCCCPYVGSFQAVGLPRNNPSGFTQGDFTPPSVTRRPARWASCRRPHGGRRPISPDIDNSPDGLYRKLPQGLIDACAAPVTTPARVSLRQTRPTVERSARATETFEPLAMRQHRHRPLPDRSQPDRAGHPAG